MFRIDHALGFFRIYGFPWNPVHNQEFLPLSHDQAREKTGGPLPGFQPRDDDNEENRAANRAEGMKLLRMIQDAAGDAVVIAEDLGMVPDYVRPALAELEIPGMKVPHWEVQEHSNELVPGADYSEISFATYASHDHLPMKMQWEYHREIVIKDLQSTGEYWESWRFIHGLAKYAGIEWDDEAGIPGYDAAVRESLLSALAASESRYVGIMITDLLGLVDRINTPGVAGDQNWTWRLPYTAKDLSSDQELLKIGKGVKKLLNDGQRVSTVSQAHEDRGCYDI